MHARRHGFSVALFDCISNTINKVHYIIHTKIVRWEFVVAANDINDSLFENLHSHCAASEPLSLCAHIPCT